MKLKEEAISIQLENLLTNAMIAKFKDQGHNVTGKGIASIKTVVKEKANGLIIEISGEDYMGFQDAGRKAGSMPPIDALMKWVQLKGIASDMKEVKKIAWGIAINMKKIGMHSKNSRIDMSKRHAISSSIETSAPKINELLFKMFDKNFDLLVKNMTTNEKLIIEL